jgi:hypothetical protein
MQFSHALDQILREILLTNPCLGPIALMKLDISDRFYCIALNVAHARLTNPKAKCVGVSLNTSKLAPRAAERALKALADRLGLPVCDPSRTGVAALAKRLAKI